MSRPDPRNSDIYCRPQAWTPERDEIIRKHYPTSSADEVASMLNTTDASIRARAYQIGVKGRSRGAVSHAFRARPPAPKASNFNALGVHYRNPTGAPISPAETEEAVRRYMETKTVTVCPPAPAWGAVSPSYLGTRPGRSAFTNFVRGGA